MVEVVVVVVVVVVIKYLSTSRFLYKSIPERKTDRVTVRDRDRQTDREGQRERERERSVTYLIFTALPTAKVMRMKKGQRSSSHNK